MTSQPTTTNSSDPSAKSSDSSDNEFQQDAELQMDIDATGFELSDAEREEIAAEVDRLERVVAEFPTKILHVNLKYNGHSESYEVRIALVLPKQTFATGGVSEAWLPTFETAIGKMIRRVSHYKEDLENVTERRHHALGTDDAVTPTMQVDGLAVQSAVDAGSYSDFRQLLHPFDPALRDRVGRWVQRYPQVNAAIGESVFLADIVEEVFLLAFDRFHQRTPQLMFGPWLETLIDPAVQAIANDPAGELEAISFQRTWQEIR